MAEGVQRWTVAPTDAPAPADPGTYVILVELGAEATIEFGAAGSFDLPTGWYAYVGSAFGPGGLARVDRHRELAAGDRDARHWHVDYLLGHPETTLGAALLAVDADVECDVGTALATTTQKYPVGASDCDCTGHLFCGEARSELEDAVHAVLE